MGISFCQAILVLSLYACLQGSFSMWFATLWRSRLLSPRHLNTECEVFRAGHRQVPREGPFTSRYLNAWCRRSLFSGTPHRCDLLSQVLGLEADVRSEAGGQYSQRWARRCHRLVLGVWALMALNGMFCHKVWFRFSMVTEQVYELLGRHVRFSFGAFPKLMMFD